MKKAGKAKIKWYIAVIVILILALSIASWVQFVQEAGKALDQQSSAASNTGVLTGSIYRSAETITPVTTIASSHTPVFAVPAQGAAGSNTAENKEKPSFFQKCVRKVLRLCEYADQFTDKVDTWFSVFKRKDLSKIDTRVSYYLTKEVYAVQVLSGKGKWLFYKTKTDGDPIADYEGTNLYTEETMEKKARSVLAFQKKLADRGTKLAMLVVPNKEQIYSEYMPDTYVHAEKSRSDLLIEYLSEKGVNIVSPKKDLLDTHMSQQIYYYYDTHWNQLGAYIGVRNVLASWGISIPDLSERTYSSKNLYGNYHYCGQDDLARMVGLRDVLTDEIEYEVDGTVLMDWPTFEAQQSHKKGSHLVNENAPIKKSLLLIGDSFRPAMVPALREQFSDVYVILQDFYTPDVFNEINPDYLILEYSERYIHRIDKVKSLIE